VHTSSHVPRNEKQKIKKKESPHQAPNLREAVVMAVSPEYGISATGGPRDLR